MITPAAIVSGVVVSMSEFDIESSEAAKILCELCAGFYHLGWNMGTGGGMSIQDPDLHSSLVFLSPSGVHKERMQPTDLFVFDLTSNAYVYKPEGRKPSASTPLFLMLHGRKQAYCVIHTHSMFANLASSAVDNDRWQITNQEYIKGIPQYESDLMHQNSDTLTVPIIPNQATEDLLAGDLMTAVTTYPETPCVLVRNHGAYHFGRDVWKCKAQAECLEYLFELQWRKNAMH